MSRSVALVLVLGVGACDSAPSGIGLGESGRESSAAVQSTRDSAGVSITTFTSVPSGSPVGVVDYAESVRLGADQGDEADSASIVGWPQAVVLRGDGTVVIADAQARTLRLFDEFGTLVGSYGGPGQGPGELESIDGLFLLSADSLLVSDWNMRLTALPADSGDAQTYSFVPHNLDAAEVIPRAVGSFSDGSILFRRVIERNEAGAGFPQVSLFRGDRRGSVLAEFGAFPRVSYVSVPGPGRLNPRSSSERIRVTTGPLFYIHSDSLFWASPSLNEVRVFDKAGGLKRILRFDLDSVDLGELGFRTHSAARADLPREAERLLQDRREQWGTGPFAGMVLDTRGNLLFREQLMAEADTAAPARWFVFSPSGEHTGHLDLPYWWGVAEADLLLTEFNAIAFELDADAVPSIVVSPLSRW